MVPTIMTVIAKAPGRPSSTNVETPAKKKKNLKTDVSTALLKHLATAARQNPLSLPLTERNLTKTTMI